MQNREEPSCLPNLFANVRLRKAQDRPCRERVICPLFEAHELSALFVVCSGDRACVAPVSCGRRL